jgi:hypothetical protein
MCDQLKCDNFKRKPPTVKANLRGNTQKKSKKIIKALKLWDHVLGISVDGEKTLKNDHRRILHR